jgi:diacylglycerol kinase (ATP)
VVHSRSLMYSFDYAIRGIVYALRTQRNMRWHFLVTIAVFVAALAFRISGLELVALAFAVGLVLVAELVNTAVEATVDLATDGYEPLAATAKDVAAGAVLVSAVTAVAVGYVVFFARVTPLAQELLVRSRASDAMVSVLALALTSVVVLAVKAITHEKGASFLRGGWPSGHTALATAMAAAIGYSTNSAKAMVLAMFIAALVAQSRVESEAHTIPQTVAGAVLGFLLATAAFQIFWS